ncbi:SgcJ/EcaC family oxidoreductase [Verrucomicrobium sp. BvORR034]|uniref:YybH family protein n=1 Tax=Verrucomicrobium sp. BvORR034 TaxID=1396418 RepID=UPI0006794D7E|nr:SgcJ/EcaC family oxidoreductase [Verrucomicrobium sp. BvORR034]
MKVLSLSIASLLMVVGGVSAQETDQAATTPEQTAVNALNRAYEVAYNKGDVKALASFFAEDAEFSTEDGRTLTGHAAIEEGIRDSFAGSKGSKLEIASISVRRLSADVVVEKGATKVTAKDGDVERSTYTAIHVKKDDKWRISQLIETPYPEESPGAKLAELDWLIGDWEDVDKENDLSVRSQYVWSKGAAFITRNVTVKQGEETLLEGWQIIGWDPVEGSIRSWTFDAEGGFAEGRWTREGERWLVRESGVNPDGGRTTVENTITKVGEDKLTWQSGNRTLDGEPLPSIGVIEVKRVKGN